MKKFFTLFALMFFAIPCSFSQITIKGHVYGWDAKPMPKANMTLYSLPKQSTSIAIGEDGSFAFSVPKPEGYQLYVTGVNHEDMSMPLIITATTPVELNLQLAATTPNKPHQDSVWVVQNAIGKPKRTLMTQQADGTYKAQIETSAKVYAYQIEGFVERLLGMNETETFPLLVTGTQYDKLGYLSIPRNAIIGSRYISQIEVTQSPFDLVFDPQKVFKEGTKAIVTSTPAQVASFANIFMETEELQHEINSHLQKVGDSYQDLRQVHDAFVEKVNGESDHVLKLWRIYQQISKVSFTPEDSTWINMLFKELPSDSPFLSFQHLDSAGSTSLEFGFLTADSFDPKVSQEFIDRILLENPYPTLKIAVLYSIATYTKWRLDRKGMNPEMDDEELYKQKQVIFQKYYNMLQSQYGDTELAKKAKMKWGSNKDNK